MGKLTKAVEWKNVHIFISSTFNDMHAERDYLVKNVFPRLSDWCEERRIRMIDVDLRWGVSETDTMNKKVVGACLKNIDKCRPFFICLLGQRRGWVPRRDDISSDTYASYPAIDGYAGNASVTEMEILHALTDPLRMAGSHSSDRTDEHHHPVQRAFFYLRDPSYLDALPSTPDLLRKTYTNELIDNCADRAKADEEVRTWREVTIPATRRPVHQYSARWNPHAETPDLRIPLSCPSAEPRIVAQWRRLWALAKFELSDGDLEIPTVMLKNAEEFNAAFTRGRLEGFSTGSKTLADVIFSDLTEAIREQFQEHIDLVEGAPIDEDDLQNEIDKQGCFLALNSDSFIQRANDFDQLDAYAAGPSRKLFVLTSPAGSGKSMFLAQWITRHRATLNPAHNESLHFRFIGQSDNSTAFYSLWHTLLHEIKEQTEKLEDEVLKDAEGGETRPEAIPSDPVMLHNGLHELLKRIGSRGKTIIVLDALNQLGSGLRDLSWLQSELPDGIKMIVSFKRGAGDAEAEALHARVQNSAEVSEIGPFESAADRTQLIDVYLKQYFKELDQKHIDALLGVEASKNPLFLKIVLNELRVFGAFLNIKEKILADFGNNPLSAFDGVLKRLENDPAYSTVPSGIAVPLIFGLLAHARSGLSADELTHMLLATLGQEESQGNFNHTRETVFLYLRQMRPYTTRRNGKYDFFYESFKMAAQHRYVSREPHGQLRTTKDWHRILANHFYEAPLWQGTIATTDAAPFGRERGGEADYCGEPNRRKVSQLPYHLTEAGDWERTEETLSNLWFLEAKVRASLVIELQEDFTAAMTAFARQPDGCGSDHDQGTQKRSERGPWLDVLREYRDFIRSRSHRLSSTPLMTIQEACNFAYSESIVEQALSILGRDDNAGHMWLQRANRSYSNSDPCMQTLAGKMKHVRLTHGGRSVISVGDDGVIKTWDVKDGICRDTIYDIHVPEGCATVLSDGSQIVTGGMDGAIRFWSLATSQCTRQIQAHAVPVEQVTCSPDDSVVVSYGHAAEAASEIRLWDVQFGRCVATVRGHGHVLFGETGLALLASVCPDKKIRVKNVSTGEDVCILGRHLGPMTSAAISPDGKLMAGGCLDGRIKMWDLEDGRRLRQMQDGPGVAHALAFTRDGLRLVSGGTDKAIRVWSIQGECLGVLQGHTDWIEDIEIAPDGGSAVSRSGEGIVKIWDLRVSRFTNDYDQHHGDVRAIRILSAGDRAVTGSDHGEVKLWEIESGRCLRTCEQAKFPVRKIVEAADGQKVVTLGGTTYEGYNSEAKLWDLKTGRCLWTIPGHNVAIDEIVLMPDGKRLVVIVNSQSSEDRAGAIGIASLEEPLRLELVMECKNGVSAIKVSSDGTAAVILERDDSMYICDIRRKARANTLAIGPRYLHARGCRLHVTADDKWIVVSSPSREVWVWEATSGRLVTPPRWSGDGSGHCGLVAFANQIATYSDSNMLEVWDLDSCEYALQESFETADECYLRYLSLIHGHTLSVTQEEDGIAVRTLDGSSRSASFSLEGRVYACKTSLDGTRIVVGGEAGVVDFLRVVNGVPQVPTVMAWRSAGVRAGTVLRALGGEQPLAFGCPFCRSWSRTREAMLGGEAACSTCGRILKLSRYRMSGRWGLLAHEDNSH
jgi:WD40 repeat protein